MVSSRNRAFRAYADSCSSTYALGQLTIPYQETIRDIARGFPACFNASEMVVVLGHAQNFVRQISTIGLSRWGGTASPGGVQKQLDRVWNDLNGWKNRLLSEGNKRYCNTDPATKDDHWKLVQVISQPYAEASGVEGAKGVVAAAKAQLFDDFARMRVTLGPVDQPWFDKSLLPQWMDLRVIAGIAVGLLGLIVLSKASLGRAPAAAKKKEA